jgi:ABC-type lipoprotein release transport system permease subunit
VALGLMLASGLVPALRAARLPIVQALRKVE